MCRFIAVLDKAGIPDQAIGFDKEDDAIECAQEWMLAADFEYPEDTAQVFSDGAPMLSGEDVEIMVATR